jgi:hypothetical protein
MTEKEYVTEQVVLLDYKRFENISFNRCRLVYSGGMPPELINVDILNCEFLFDGSAKNTLEFMTLLARSGEAELVVKHMLGLTEWEPVNGE